MKHFANSILEKPLLPVKSIGKYLHPAARCLVIPHTYLTIVGRKNILSVAIGIHPAVHYLSGRGLTLGDILRSTGKAYGYGSKALRSVGTGMRKLLCDLSCTLVGICAQSVVLFKSVKSCRRTFLIDKADYLINKFVGR